MKIVSQSQCQEWLNAKLGYTSGNIEAYYASCIEYWLPVDTGRKTAIARALTRSLDDKQPGLLWITDWGIFDSSENMALFDGYRESLGESRDIHAAPGHIFDGSDLPQVECLLDLALYFFWDATLCDGSGRTVVRTSHDGWISLHAKDRAGLQQFEQSLEPFKLTPVDMGD